LFSLFGSTVAYFVLIWWLTITTGSATILATASFITVVLTTVCMPIAGVFADKFNRKAIILIVDASQAIVTLVVSLLFRFNLIVIATLLIFMSIRSIFQAFHAPTVGAIVPTMVPPKHLTRINSIGFLFLGVIQIFAQLVAAILWLVFPIYAILWIDIITFGIALIPLIIIRIPSIKRKATEDAVKTKKSSFFRDFAIGIKTLKIIPGLLIILIVSMIISFLNAPLKVLMSLYVHNVHGGQAGHFALTLAFFQGGIVVGAIITIIKSEWKNKIRVIFINMALGMIGLVIFALAPRGIYIIIGIGGLITGITLPIVSSLTSTFIQTTVPLDKMGRVSSISGSISASILPIGTILSGPLADILGISPLFFYCSVLGLVVIISTWLFTNIRKVDLDKVEENKKTINEKIKNFEI